ncbi:DUF2927 domain-containing protein [Propionicimonas sp.]|uniref:DUF2927 domain-containing protein n=1 Tax=Propionicimonas sp. TaxID=1955623 RepID=UPI0039E2C001
MTATATTTPTTGPSPTTVKPRISRQGLAYFYKIALGAEYGDKARVVKRWVQPTVTVRVHGTASDSSRACLARVVSDFNALTSTTDLALTRQGSADIQLYFAPVTRFRALDRGYVPGNDGFFSTWWTDNAMDKARVLIRTTGIADTIRCHLIREELTQSMGLMRDANDHPGSIFYGKYLPAPVRYSHLDQELIRLLYSGALDPGDTKAEIRKKVTVAG